MTTDTSVHRTEHVSNADEFRRVLVSIGMTGERAEEMYRNLSAAAKVLIIDKTRIVFE